MSAANEQITHLRALDLNKKAVSSTFAVRTGRVVDNFVIDNPVDITSGSVYTITVPAGYKMGQKLLLVCTARTASMEAQVSVSAHETSDPEIFYFDAVDEYLYLVWTGTEWSTISNSCGTSTGL